MVIYFAHPMQTYGTPKERHVLNHIRDEFPTAKIIDPSKFSTNPDKFRFQHYLKHVKACDLFIFMPVRGDLIGKGIYEEVKYAHKIGKRILYFAHPIFYNRFRLIQRGNDWQYYARVVAWMDEDSDNSPYREYTKALYRMSMHEALRQQALPPTPPP